LGTAKAGCLLTIVLKPCQDQCQLKIFELPNWISTTEHMLWGAQLLNGGWSWNTFYKGCLLYNYIHGWLDSFRGMPNLKRWVSGCIHEWWISLLWTETVSGERGLHNSNVKNIMLQKILSTQNRKSDFIY